MKSRRSLKAALASGLLIALCVGFQNCSSKIPSSVSTAASSTTTPTVSNPAVISASVADVSVSPGSTAVVIVALSQTASSNIIFTYQTVDGTAVANSYYTPITSVGTILAGSLTATVQIPTTFSSSLSYANSSFSVVFQFESLVTPASAQGTVSFISSVPVQTASTYSNSGSLGTLAAGVLHTCALSRSGGLYCWGYNGQGQLGSGNGSNSSTPVLVAGMESGVQAVTSGYDHSCAIQNGALLCWGQDSSSQLGDGSSSNSSFPVNVHNMSSGVTAVSAGYDHTCAIKNGALYCWGGNQYAQVGHNLGTQVVPYLVPGFSSGVTAVRAGTYSTCVIKSAALYCWGYNNNGTSGNGSYSTDNNRNPTSTNLSPVSGLDSGVTAVSGSDYAVCALKNGSIYTWGQNGYGQLGLGGNNSVSSPNLVTGLTATVTQVSTNSSETCALKAGAVYCWGNSSYYQLGYGNNSSKTQADSNAVPLSLNAGEVVTELATGGMDNNNGGWVCVRTSASRVFCWGYNSNGQLGDGTSTNRSTPVELSVLE